MHQTLILRAGDPVVKYMRDTEKLIKHLRNRRGKICFYSFTGLVSLILGIVFFLLSRRLLFSLCDKNLFESVAPMIGVGSSACLVFAVVNLALAGNSIAILFVELFSCSKDRLLVEMWDRLKELENKNKI